MARMFKTFAQRKPAKDENSSSVNEAPAPAQLRAAAPAPAPEPAPELGSDVLRFLGEWGEASREASRLGPSVVVLFQDVPGCATCTRFGARVLSHGGRAALINKHFK